MGGSVMKSGRSSRWLTLLSAALLSTPLLCGPALGAGSAPYWPSEREEKLKALDEQLLDVQRELFNARMTRDAGTVERLSPVFKEVTNQRLELLRALGHLQ
jgi:hypothetical protein